GVACLVVAVALAQAAPAAAAPFPGLGGVSGRDALAAGGARAQARALPAPAATPRAQCGAASRPAPGLQGRVPAGADQGYTCNTTLVGHEGTAGGFKVLRFVDKAGHECAYYDTTLIFPLQATGNDQPTGAAVLDMSNPAKPVRTETLVTPAMQTPHESLLLSEKRGLLAAVMGNAF